MGKTVKLYVSQTSLSRSVLQYFLNNRKHSAHHQKIYLILLCQITRSHYPGSSFQHGLTLGYPAQRPLGKCKSVPNRFVPESRLQGRIKVTRKNAFIYNKGDLSVCQTHFPLEIQSFFRLIYHWKRLKVPYINTYL